MRFGGSPGNVTVLEFLHTFTAMTIVFNPGAGLQVNQQAIRVRV